MKKFLVAFIAAFALVAGAAHGAGGLGYIWGYNYDDPNTGDPILRPSIAGGSYDITDTNLSTKQSYAVTAFQDELYRQGLLSYADWASENGSYGPKTKVAVHYFQQIFLDNHTAAQEPDGLANNGRIGEKTAKALWQQQVLDLEAFLGIPSHFLHGIIMSESKYDPGAWNGGGDRGIGQFNPHGAYIEVDNDFEAIAQAHDRIGDIATATYNGAHRDTARGTFTDLTAKYGSNIPVNVRWRMAASSHNTSQGADEWAYCWVAGEHYTSFQTGTDKHDCGLQFVQQARYYGGSVNTAGAAFPN